MRRPRVFYMPGLFMAHDLTRLMTGQFLFWNLTGPVRLLFWNLTGRAGSGRVRRVSNPSGLGPVTLARPDPRGLTRPMRTAARCIIRDAYISAIPLDAASVFRFIFLLVGGLDYTRYRFIYGVLPHQPSRRYSQAIARSDVDGKVTPTLPSGIVVCVVGVGIVVGGGIGGVGAGALVLVVVVVLVLLSSLMPAAWVVFSVARCDRRPARAHARTHA